jgi:hypothetical protein
MPNSPVILNEGIDDTLVTESCSDPLLLSKKLEKLVKRFEFFETTAEIFV